MCSCYECIYARLDIFGDHYCSCSLSDCYGRTVHENSGCDSGKKELKG